MAGWRSMQDPNHDASHGILHRPDGKTSLLDRLADPVRPHLIGVVRESGGADVHFGDPNSAQLLKRLGYGRDAVIAGHTVDGEARTFHGPFLQSLGLHRGLSFLRESEYNPLPPWQTLNGSPTIVRLDRGDWDRRSSIGRSLALAFHDEPNFKYLLPSSERRLRALPWFFDSFCAGIGLRCGVVDLPPDGSGGALEDERSRRMPEPHWYLMALGVDPARQGEEAGKALLAHGLARTDEVGLPWYLETFRSTTANFYAKYGFEMVGEAREIGLAHEEVGPPLG